MHGITTLKQSQDPLHLLVNHHQNMRHLPRTFDRFAGLCGSKRLLVLCTLLAAFAFVGFWGQGKPTPAIEFELCKWQPANCFTSRFAHPRRVVHLQPPSKQGKGTQFYLFRCCCMESQHTRPRKVRRTWALQGVGGGSLPEPSNDPGHSSFDAAHHRIGQIGDDASENGE